MCVGGAPAENNHQWGSQRVSDILNGSVAPANARCVMVKASSSPAASLKAKSHQKFLAASDAGELDGCSSSGAMNRCRGGRRFRARGSPPPSWMRFTGTIRLAQRLKRLEAEP